jgi:hypothetical protein
MLTASEYQRLSKQDNQAVDKTAWSSHIEFAIRKSFEASSSGGSAFPSLNVAALLRRYGRTVC